MSQSTEITPTAQFTAVLEAVLRIAQQHPDYRFELIQPWVDQLRSGQLTVEALATQLGELSSERQMVGLQIFEHGLLRARQATYQPRNALDTFIEQQLYGVQDSQAVSKSLVGELLRQQEARPKAVDNLPFIEGRPKTQPLPPNQLPQRPMPPQTQPLPPNQVPPRPPRKP